MNEETKYESKRLTLKLKLVRMYVTIETNIWFWFQLCIITIVWRRFRTRRNCLCL